MIAKRHLLAAWAAICATLMAYLVLERQAIFLELWAVGTARDPPGTQQFQSRPADRGTRCLSGQFGR